MQGRSLLASCAPLQVGSQSSTFDNCVDFSKYAGAPFTLYYTLEADPSGTGTTFKGGIQATSTGYAAIAFSKSGQMIGSDAVIVKPDSSAASGASVNGYVLPNYNPSDVNAAAGTFPLTATNAAKNSDGSLAATFTASLSGTPDIWANKVTNFLYVNNGMMQSNNQLGTHVVPGGKYGAAPVTLQASSGTSSALPVTTSTTGPAAAPTEATPAMETPTQPQPQPQFGAPSTDNGPADLASTVAGATAMGASAPAPGPSADDACSVTVNGKVQTYNACFTVNNVGQDFMVYYTVVADPSNVNSTMLHMAMSATSDGYVAVGFPTKAGTMVGSTAAILQACSTCPSGASIQEYYLAGEKVSQVQPSTNMAFDNAEASASNGMLTGSFVTTLVGTSTQRRRRALKAFTATSFPMIYAAGPLASDGSLLQHYDDGNSNVNLDNGLDGASNGGDNSGGDNGAVADSDPPSIVRQKNAHSWLMVLSWGVIIPLGIFFARYFQDAGTWWFQVHRAFQSTGFLMAIAGLALGFTANGGWETDQPVHRDLGMAATALACVQVTALVARPDKHHAYRGLWYHGHAWIGRSAAILAIANIYYGIINVYALGVWAWAAYTGVLGAVVLAYVFMEMRRCVKGRDVSANSDSSAATAADNGKEFITSGTTNVSAVEAGRAYH